jgi:hypothetical protein
LGVHRLLPGEENNQPSEAFHDCSARGAGFRHLGNVDRLHRGNALPSHVDGALGRLIVAVLSRRL